MLRQDVKSFLSELVAIGKHVDNDELMGYILNKIDGSSNRQDAGAFLF
jgi:hypothetical protein